MSTGPASLRLARPEDRAGAYWVCLKTGDHGADGERYYREDPDALGRVYVGPYLEFEPGFSLVLEDGQGVAGYALGALDSRNFFDRYVREWLPDLQRRFPEPTGDASGWTRVEQVHYLYHHPDLYCPEPYEVYPSHLHIDLLPRVQGAGWGRRLIEALVGRLRDAGSVGVHLGMSASNVRAYGFYRRLGFQDLAEVGEGADASRYLGMRLTG